MGIFDKLKRWVLEVRRPPDGTFVGMPSEGEFEAAIERAVKNPTQHVELIAPLLRTQVCMVFNGNPAVPSPHTAPLIVTALSGKRQLAIFTRPDRVGPVQQMIAPDYGFGMQVEFGWAISGVVPGHGAVINPGWETVLELSPEDLDELRRRYNELNAPK